METIAKTTAVDKESADCVVVGIFKPKHLSDSAKKLDKLYRGIISQACRRGTAGGNLGQITTLQNSSRSKHQRIIVVGCGDEDSFSISAYIKALNTVASEIKRNKINNIINCLTELPIKDADIFTKVQVAVTTIGEVL